MLFFGTPARSSATEVSHSRFVIPTSARQLIVVSSPTYDPPGDLATLQSFQRASPSAPWRQEFPTWKAEIGAGELVDVRREGDHATPTGVYSIGTTMYGNEPNPGGLHESYHRLLCGDWWDEDPFSSRYNQFVEVSCGVTPDFAPWSEPLWREVTAYRYFAVIDYNLDPTVSGPDAPGSGIFLHAWVDGPTEGCVALPLSRLLEVLRWIEPDEHHYIEIGTNAEVGEPLTS